MSEAFKRCEDCPKILLLGDLLGDITVRGDE